MIVLAATLLVAVTVAIHAGGRAALLRALLKSHAQLPQRFWPLTRLLIGVTWALMLIHLVGAKFKGGDQ